MYPASRKSQRLGRSRLGLRFQRKGPGSLGGFAEAIESLDWFSCGFTWFLPWFYTIIYIYINVQAFLKVFWGYQMRVVCSEVSLTWLFATFGLMF